jgi:hypothetical protein
MNNSLQKDGIVKNLSAIKLYGNLTQLKHLNKKLSGIWHNTNNITNTRATIGTDSKPLNSIYIIKIFILKIPFNPLKPKLV